MIGRGSPQLAPHEDEGDRDAQSDDRSRHHRRIAVDRAFETRDDQAECGGAKHRAEQVEIVAVQLGLGQMPAEQQRQDRERRRRGEHPRPGAECEDDAANGRRERGGDRDDDAVDAEPAPQLAGRIGRSQDRGGDAERRGGAERLRGADDEQEWAGSWRRSRRWWRLRRRAGRSGRAGGGRSGRPARRRAGGSSPARAGRP